MAAPTGTESLAIPIIPDESNKLSIEKIARQVKRNQLIRCWQSLVNEYPPVAGMEKEQAADWLLALEDQGKLRISFECNNELLEPRILRAS